MSFRSVLTWSFSLLLEIVAGIVAMLPLPLAYFFPAPSGELSLRACYKLRTTKPAILLLHASSRNWTEWLVGIFYLCVWSTFKGNVHRVYTMNYDGVISSDRNKGIDDYARGKVREKIKSIVAAADTNKQVVIIGHSMGGLIGEYYAANLAAEDGVQVVGLFTIASPWRGSPLLTRLVASLTRFSDRFSRWAASSVNFKKSRLVDGASTLLNSLAQQKRYQQMITSSPFLEQLCTSRARMYGFAGSTVDLMVPCPRHAPDISSSMSAEALTAPTNYQSQLLGHNALIASPFLWAQIGSWLNNVEKAVKE